MYGNLAGTVARLKEVLREVSRGPWGGEAGAELAFVLAHGGVRPWIAYKAVHNKDTLHIKQ